MPGTEIDEHGNLVLDANDPAEAVLVMRHLVLHREGLNGADDNRDVEGASWQVAPGSGAGCLHQLLLCALLPPAASFSGRVVQAVRQKVAIN